MFARYNNTKLLSDRTIEGVILELLLESSVKTSLFTTLVKISPDRYMQNPQNQKLIPKSKDLEKVPKKWEYTPENKDIISSTLRNFQVSRRY